MVHAALEQCAVESLRTSLFKVDSESTSPALLASSLDGAVLDTLAVDDGIPFLSFNIEQVMFILRELGGSNKLINARPMNVKSTKSASNLMILHSWQKILERYPFLFSFAFVCLFFHNKCINNNYNDYHRKLDHLLM